MKVFWTETAIRHLSSIRAYVEQTSPTYAKHLVDRITARSQQIAAFPNSGRLVPEFNNDRVREIIEGNYRIIYTLQGDQIEILAVLHGAQQIVDDQ
jgi:toxin ParE1/3/4